MSTTRSKRAIKKVGVTEGKMKALAELKKLKDEGGKRTDQYEVEDVPQILEDVNSDDYNARNEARRRDDFIVGDDGYKDHGGDEWEDDDEEVETRQSKRKPKQQAGMQSLQGFFNKPGSKRTTVKNDAKAKINPVSAQQSKDMMNSLYSELDNINPDNADKIYEEPKKEDLAFNMEEILDTKYDIAIGKPDEEEPAVSSGDDQENNVNQLKRKHNEIRRSTVESIEPKEPPPTPAPADKPTNENLRPEIHKMEVDEDWEKIKLQNQERNEQFNTVDYSQINQKKELPLNDDGSLSIFWYDAHEEFAGDGTVYIFGKCYDQKVKKFMSISLQIKDLERIMYAVPKDRTSDCMDVHAEFTEIFKSRFPKIKGWRARPIEKNYAFELPIPNGKGKFLEIRYKANHPPFPPYMKGGETFSHLFGANTSVMEHFIIQKKMMGPCWMTIQNPSLSTEFKQTWCDFELIVNNPMKNVAITLEDKNKESPPLTVLSFALKTHKAANKTKELAMISCVVHNSVECDRPTPNPRDNYNCFSAIRKIDGLQLPNDLQKVIKDNKHQVQCFQNEKALLEFFIGKIKLADPDLMVCHGLTNGIFDILLHRIQTLKIAHWSRLGRFKRSQFPKSGNSNGGFFIPRQVTVGRMLCDTFLSARELIRETNYDLTELSRTQLSIKRDVFDLNLLRGFYEK